MVASGETADVNPAEVASGLVAEVTSDVLERVPDVSVASVKLRVVYPQTLAADRLFKPEIAVVIVPVEVVTLAAVARPERSEVLARVPEVNVLSVKLRVAYAQTCEADILLSAEIEAEVASGEVALVN